MGAKGVDRFTKGLEDRGFTARDVPKAIIFHEALGIAMLALTWTACFYFPPSQNVYLRSPIERMMRVMPARLTRTIHANAFLNSKLGASYLESSCVRKLIRPITFPAKLFLTFKMVAIYRSLAFLPFNRDVVDRDSVSDAKEESENAKDGRSTVERNGSRSKNIEQRRGKGRKDGDSSRQEDLRTALQPRRMLWKAAITEKIGVQDDDSIADSSWHSFSQRRAYQKYAALSRLSSCGPTLL